MAIADDILGGDNSANTNPNKNLPGDNSAPTSTAAAAPVKEPTISIRSNPTAAVQADPIPTPDKVSLAKPAAPTPAQESAKPKETISLQTPAVTDHVEFSPGPAASVSSDTTSATDTKKKKTQALEDKSMDLLSEGLDHIKNMAEGGDPTIQAQFNSWLNKFSLSNASQRSALMMNLRSQPGFVPGSGEGTAAMLMMARGTNTTLADMMSKMSVQNVQFMMDANKLGIEKAIQVKTFLNEQETHELQNQISEISIQQGKLNLAGTEQINQANELKTLKDYGQYDKIAEILNSKYPGMNVSSASIRSADPATLNAMASQKDSIQALVDTGNAEAAKQQAIGYYSQFWQNEGFKSQEEAIAFANKLDFSAAAFKARSAFIESTSSEIRKYAVTKDSSAGKAAVVDYYKAIGRDPASVGATLTPEQVTEMRQFFDPKAPVVTDLTAEDKKQLGIDWEWYQQSKSAAGANTVGAIYNSFADAAKNAGAPFDADQERMVKSWINAKLTYGDIAANASAPNGYTIADKATLMPWDDPATSFYFTTWPKYDFTTPTPTQLDAGGQRYSSINSTNYGSYTAAEDKRLDDAYLAFLHDPNHDKNMTREQWYFNSKGGTVPIQTSKSTYSYTPSDPLSADKFTSEFKNATTDAISAKMKDSAFVNDAINYGVMQNITNPANLPTDNASWADLNTKSQGYIALNGVPYKVYKPNDANHVLNYVSDGITFVKGSAAERDMGGPASFTGTRVTDSDGKIWMLVLKGYAGKYGPGTLYRYDPVTGKHEIKQA